MTEVDAPRRPREENTIQVLAAFAKIFVRSWFLLGGFVPLVLDWGGAYLGIEISPDVARLWLLVVTVLAAIWAGYRMARGPSTGLSITPAERRVKQPITTEERSVVASVPMETEPKWDLFISYVAEDRDAVATPLAEALRAKGLKVWYDVFELRPGESLWASINEGVRESRLGLVILSPSFFAKKSWAERELRGLFSRAVREGDRPSLVPVWYRLGAQEIAQHYPLLSDIVSIP